LLKGVTVEDIRAAAAEVLHPERAAVTIAGPETLVEAIS
jgi:predicted Zn-dependent peptidase